ncbi:NAD(P)-binding protein [Cadophora sp. DSE1049]|nr:NAD(P)-binding protein [Cadophora sp. DSE1049]
MGLLPLFIQPFRTLKLPPSESFASQTVLITGANSGLGLETARHIVILGASKVILGVRTLAKGEAAKFDIETTTGRTGVVEVWQVDLERFDSVEAFVARAALLGRLDVAIMNAGLASLQWNLSPEGFERQLQVNCLSTALMMLLLLPVLVRTRLEHPDATPHLVVVGTDMHAKAKFEERKCDEVFEALNDEQRWEKSQAIPTERYAVSKLLTHYMAYELVRLTPSINGEPAIIVNIVGPGFCKSELMTHEPGRLYLLEAMQFLTARTTEEGSKTIVDSATRGIDSHGKYIEHQKFATVGKLVSSDEGLRLRNKIWHEVLEILVSAVPAVERVVYGDF